MENDTPDAGPGSFSRRDVLRKSALVGGTLIWVAPAVQTLASPAFATSSPVPGTGNCTHQFFVKYDLPGTGSLGGFSQSDGSCPGVVTGCQSTGTVTVTGTSPTTANILIGNNIVGTIVKSAGATDNCVVLDFTFTNGCNVNEASSYVIIKAGDTCVSDGSGQLLAGDRTGDRYTLCSPNTPGSGLSHVDLCICLSCV